MLAKATATLDPAMCLKVVSSSKLEWVFLSNRKLPWDRHPRFPTCFQSKATWLEAHVTLLSEAWVLTWWARTHFCFILMIRVLLLFYFTLSLHFTPGLQSAVCSLHFTLSLQSAVCSLRFTLAAPRLGLKAHLPWVTCLTFPGKVSSVLAVNTPGASLTM